MKRLLKNTSLFKKRNVILAIIVVLFVIWNVVIGIFLFNQQKKQTIQEKKNEITAILNTSDKRLQEKYYVALIERIGPEKAQDALLQSGLPPDGNAHLLNHTVGDWLYKKYGTDGLVHCKNYFLSSCYHGFVIQAVAKKGTDVLSKIMSKCWGVGSNTAAQCAHAIGHGILAFEGYRQLPKALSDCDAIALTSRNFPTYNCYDGVFMENIQAVHDDGKPSKDRWLKVGDLVYPCNSSEIGEKYVRACWSNQPAWLYQELDGDFTKMGAECLALTNPDYQEACFDSIARMIHPASKGDTDFIFKSCKKMPSAYWDTLCQISIVRSAFSIGDKKTPFTICSHFASEENASCYEALVWAIAGNSKNNSEKTSLCKKIADASWRSDCHDAKLFH